MKIRYSLSHVLLVVTIVALICGWIIDHRQLNKRYLENTAALVQLMNRDIQQYGVIHTYFMNIAPPTLDKANQAVKVVVLVYWGSWCGPCMAMVPHERELFERMKGKPFVLLGVNCGDPREKAKETTQSKQMEWPSWWDGGSTDGPIQSAYNVLHWPTVYLLDAHGTIRYMEVSGKELDAAVDELLAKMEPTSPVNGSEPKPNP